jgi:hypothetical protein
MSTSNFDKNSDKIAISIREFTLKDFNERLFDRHAEPYIVSLAVDSHGTANPELSFNTLPFPRFKKGQTKVFHGHGHLIYGPKQPGEFVAYSILFMESDKDNRDFGETIERILAAPAPKAILKAILVANPGYAAVASGLEAVAGLIASEMKKDKDDELFRTGGALLRDVTSGTPYDINTGTRDGNDFISCETTIIPLVSTAPDPGGLAIGSGTRSAPLESDFASTIQTIEL